MTQCHRFRPARFAFILLALWLPLSACDRDPVAPADPGDIRTGILAVHTTASGQWLPDGGLQLLVDDDPASVHEIGLNGSYEVQLMPGDHVLELFRGGGEPLYPACRVDGEPRRHVQIEAGRTTLAGYELFCEVVLQLDVQTMGTNVDPDGYRTRIGWNFVVDRDYPFTTYDLPLQGSLRLDRDSPTWWREENPETWAYLWGAAPNCTFMGDNPLVLETGGGVLIQDVHVECVDPPPATGTIYYTADQLYRVDADGAGPVPVTDFIDYSVYDLALSPDLTEFVFSRYEGGLFRIGADGTGLTQILPDDELDISGLDWAPGLIAYEQYDETTGSYSVYTIRPDGSDHRLLGEGSTPRISPDGSRILYVGRPYGYTIVDADGSDPEPLELDPNQFRNPKWSPDGARLAGSVWRQTQSEIGVVDLGTGELTVVARRPRQQLWSFAWSPVGEQIVYVASPEATDFPVDYAASVNLYTVSADGHNLARIADLGLGAIWYVDNLTWRAGP